MQNQSTLIWGALLAAVIGLVVYFVFFRKKDDDETASKTSYRAAVLHPAALQARAPVRANLANANLLSGPLQANTYTYTTDGPQFKATTGTTPQNIQAVQSRLANWAGYFVPN